MNDNDLTLTIVEDYVIIKMDNDKKVLDKTDLKEMMIEHFILKDNLDTIYVELNQLGKIMKSCV